MSAGGPSKVLALTTQPQREAPQPIYFGPEGSLFGVFHGAQRARPRPGAIVICQPGGHEYFRLHRAFRNIAMALARFGFAVLRFDYYGTGDSHGDGTDTTLDRWQADVAAAIDEVRKRSGAPRASLLGLRLGATIAWLECLRRTDVDLLVMWEPVLSGRVYLSQLRALERAWLSDPARGASPDAERSAGYLLGVPLGAGLERQLAAVDLAAGELLPSAHVVTLAAAADAIDDPRWRTKLVARYGARSYTALPTGADWSNPESIHTAVYPPSGVQVLPSMFDTVLV